VPAKKYVEIELDKPRKLLINLNSMCAFEEKTGKKFLDVTDSLSKGEFPAITDFRALFWCALIHEDPDITVEQVGEMITPADMDKLAKSIAANMPKAKEGGRPLEVKPLKD